MSRVIKFRAWHKNRDDMLHWDSLQDIANLTTLFEGGNWFPMQYTGLKDKNGVEIYEGDVVEYELGKLIDPDGGYGSDNWEMFLERAEVIYDPAKGRFKRKDRFHDFLDTPECEVIGNIYENPELLDGNK